MKSAIRRLFKKLGYELLPLTDPSASWSYTLTAADRASIKSIQQAVEKQPGDRTGWMAQSTINKYLSPARIGFYHSVVERCLSRDVAVGGQDIADLGSGPAFLFRLLSEKVSAASLTGYDASSSVNRLAACVCPTAKIVNCDILEIHQVDYDVLFCMEVLEHMRRPQSALAKIKELTRPRGWMVMTVPNGRYDQMPAKELFDHGQAYLGHVNFWSPESWPIFLEENLPGYELHTELLPSGHNFAIARAP